MVFSLPQECKWMLEIMYSYDLSPRKHCTLWSVADGLWSSSGHCYSKHTQLLSTAAVSKCNPIFYMDHMYYIYEVVHLFILIWWWHSSLSEMCMGSPGWLCVYKQCMQNNFVKQPVKIKNLGKGMLVLTKLLSSSERKPSRNEQKLNRAPYPLLAWRQFQLNVVMVSH